MGKRSMQAGSIDPMQLGAPPAMPVQPQQYRQMPALPGAQSGRLEIVDLLTAIAMQEQQGEQAGKGRRRRPNGLIGIGM